MNLASSPGHLESREETVALDSFSRRVNQCFHVRHRQSQVLISFVQMAELEEDPSVQVPQ